MRIEKTVVITVCLLIFNNIVSAERLPIDLFAKLPDYRELKISPTGEYLAVIAPLDGRETLVVLDLEEMQVASVLRLDMAQDILDFDWVNEERVVASFGRRFAGKGEVIFTAGELFAMNADGGNKKMIFGWRAGAENQADTRIPGAKPIRAAARIIDTLREDRSSILVAAYPFKGTGISDITPTIYKLNVYSGARKKRPPVPYGTTSYIADSEGTVRVAWGYDKNFELATFYRSKKSFEISPVGTLNESSIRYFPLAYDETRDRIYVASSSGLKGYGVSSYDPATGALETIWEAGDFDVYDLVMNIDETAVIAASFYDDKLRYTYFDTTHPKSRALASIARAFEDYDVEITSTTWDGKKAIIKVGNASAPDDYYLFDFDAKSLGMILSSRGWIDPAMMRPAEHFEVEARDGLIVRGYLTRPSGEAVEKLPLVVMPHGGPHGIRDENRFDPDVQLLANRGYAVLQVNYRGSGGYGAEFEEAGFRNWGTAMMDDITDAVRWAVDSGVADPDRICIGGASFGGYAALMSVVREPDLYACAIGQFGIYDLPMLFKIGDVPDTDIGKAYIESVIGTDEAELIRQSPARNVDVIMADLLVMYGGQDRRAPPSQSIALTRALDEAGIEYELFEMDDEGHGAFNEDTRAELYRRILDFLDKHIGEES
jgi:dipeptidyl aminopeptidase/acylaminoacyl peptidase